MAIKLWEAAADFSDGVIIELGYLYTNGEMIEPDYERAAYWWKRAVEYYGYYEEDSQPLAQYELGMCYYHGRGVEKNEDEALRYLEYFIDSCHRFGVSFIDPDNKMDLCAKLQKSIDIVNELTDKSKI